MRVLLTLAVFLLTSIAYAGDAERGLVLFQDHCATCHGVDARGNGPMAPVLSISPGDLTALSQSNGGAFPVGRVVQRVDGSTSVLAHGGPMPLFGLILEGPSDIVLGADGSEIVAPEAIIDIAVWLEEVQR